MKQYDIQYTTYKVFFDFLGIIINTIIVILLIFFGIKYFNNYDILIIFFIILIVLLFIVGINIIIDLTIFNKVCKQLKILNILFYDNFVKFNYEHISRTFYFNKIKNINIVSYVGGHSSFLEGYSISIEQENDNEKFYIYFARSEDIEQKVKIFNEFCAELKLNCKTAKIIYDEFRVGGGIYKYGFYSRDKIF